MLLKDEVTSFTWEACFKPSSIKIPAVQNEKVDYSEIHWLSIELKSDNAFKTIGHFVQRSIPYPLVIVAFYANRFAVQVALKRIHENDASKRIVMESCQTDWYENEGVGTQILEALKLKQLSTTDLQLHYEDVYACVEAENISHRTGNFQVASRANRNARHRLLNGIFILEDKMAHCRAKLRKNDTPFSEKVELNVELKKLEEQHNEITNQL